MIKLVASDLDGTILLNGAQHVDDSMCETIDMLGRKGIIFAPASGRQCESLVRLFSKVKSPLMYISDNGALVRYKGETIVKTPMNYNLAIEIAKDIISVPNCEVLLSGEKTAYIMPKTEEYLIRMTKVVQYKTTIIKSLDEIQEDILKVSVCDLSRNCQFLKSILRISGLIKQQRQFPVTNIWILWICVSARGTL